MNSNITEKKFDQIISENTKDEYIFDLDKLGRKDGNIILKLNEFGVSGRKCLDIGPGTGRFVRYLKSQSADLICVADISSEALNSCKEYSDDFQKLDIEHESLKYENNTFDIIISFEVLEHLKDPHNYISEIVRVSNNNAIVIMSLPNITSLISRIRMMLGLLPVAIAADETHVSFYRIKDIVRLLDRYDLSPVFLPTSISLNPMNPKSRFSLPSNKIMNSFDDSLLFYFKIKK